MVPTGTLGPPGYSREAVAAARRFLLRDAVRVDGFEQAVVAVALGWAVAFDVTFGPGTVPGPDGTCPVTEGPTNHFVLACEEYRVVRGKPRLGGRNSFGPGWGDGGRCLWQPAHLDRATEAWAVRGARPDPEQPLPPTV
jgi:hypothetical protein